MEEEKELPVPQIHFLQLDLLPYQTERVWLEQMVILNEEAVPLGLMPIAPQMKDKLPAFLGLFGVEGTIWRQFRF